jgi:hypothetical protein
MRFKNPYKTEAELCDAFVEQVKAAGWGVYPECCEWDIVLVNADGIQVGIEAKLRSNLDVVAQAIPNKGNLRRPTMLPHYVGVLVPQASAALEAVCRSLNIHVWDHAYISGSSYIGDLHLIPQYMIEHPKRIKLPEVAVQSSPGMPSPKVMSDWRIKALRACNLLEAQGYLTSMDIRGFGVDPTRWTQYWMEPGGKVLGPRGRMVMKYVPKRNGELMPSKGYEAEMQLLKEKDRA